MMLFLFNVQLRNKYNDDDDAIKFGMITNQRLFFRKPTRYLA